MAMVPVVLNSMVAGVLFYTSYQFLFIGFRNRKEKEYLTFGFIVLFQAVCALLELFGLFSKNQQDYQDYRQTYYNITAFINVLFFIFISIISNFRHKSLFALYLVLVLFTLVLNNIASNIVFTDQPPNYHVKFVEELFYRTWSVSVNPVFGIINGAQFIVLILFSFLACCHQKKNNRKNTSLILVSLLFFCLGSFTDILIDLGIVHYPVSSYFFLTLIIFSSTKLYRNIENAKKFEDIAAEGELRLRQIIDLVPNLIFAKDVNGRFVLANKAVADLYGTTPNNLLGHTHLDFFHLSNEVDFFDKMDREVIDQQKPILVPEETITGADGTTKTLQTVKIPFSYSGTKAILGVSSDITALKKSESIIKENERLLEAIFDSASVAMVLMDQTSAILKINQAGRELGLNSEMSFNGLQMGNAVNCIVAHNTEGGCGFGKECSQCRLRETIRATFARKTKITKAKFVLEVYRETGIHAYNMLLSSSYLEINATPMVLLVLEDITSIIKVKQALLESEYRYKQITSAITDYIYNIVVHNNGRVETWHTIACYSITGYRADEFDANPNLWFDIVYEDDRHKVLEFIRNISKDAEQLSIEYRMVRKGGNIIWVSNTLVYKEGNYGVKNQYDGVIRDITGQKLAEEALRISEGKFKSIVWDMQVGILLQDAKSEILLSNPKALELLGINEDQLLGKSSFDPAWNVIHEDGSPFPGNTHPVPQAIATGKPVRDVVMGVYRPKVGDRVWLLVDAEPQMNHDGTLKHVVCSFIDITGRKQAEEALDRQVRLFNTMLDNLPIGIFMVKATDGTPLIANEQAKKLLGTGVLPEATMDDLSEVYRAYKAGTNELYPTCEMPVVMGMFGKRGHIDDLEVEHPDGSRILLEIVGCPVYDANNKIWASLVGFYDITDRKNAEIALRESEKKLSVIFEYSHVGVSLSDSNGNIQYMNPAFCRLLDYNPEHTENNNFSLFAIQNNDALENELFDKLKDGRLNFINIERKFTKRDGEVVWVQMQVSTFKDFKGKVANFIAVVEDISERVLLQQKILNAIIEAEEKERSFFSQELHDGLGPILSTIKLYMQWIQNPEAKSDKSELLTDALNSVEEAIISIKEISNRLSPNVLTKFGLDIALQSYIKKIRNLGNVHFSININLPERLRTEIESMLYRVIVEAINNSLKYAKATNIIIAIVANSQGLTALFRDDGIGFNAPDALINKAGHGLFNMQNRVETYNGVFSLKSEQGKGTEIVISIPYNKYVINH